MQYARHDQRYLPVPSDIDEQIRKQYKLGRDSGTLMISTLNGLLPTRMVDMRVYC